MRCTSLSKLPTASAKDIFEMFKTDKALPRKRTFDEIVRGRPILPETARLFELVFPRVIRLEDAGVKGTSLVPPFWIGLLVWNGAQWSPQWLLADTLPGSVAKIGRFRKDARLVRFIP